MERLDELSISVIHANFNLGEKKKQWIKVKSPSCLILLFINLEIEIPLKRLVLGFLELCCTSEGHLY